MNITPNEAEEALAAIQKITNKTRRSISSSGSYIFLIITGIIWMIGFLATQFLPVSIVPTIWIVSSVIGSALSIVVGIRMSRKVHSSSVSEAGKRAGLFWLLLVFYAIAAILIAHPTDGKQITIMIVLFVMIGQMAMGLLSSFLDSVWWTIPITALALVGYFLLPNFFYLWMGVLVGGVMIALGLYIRARW